MKAAVRKVETFVDSSLKVSELRYRRLFEAAQDGILILDAKTALIEDVNPYLIKMLGYSRREFLKKKLWEVGAFNDYCASQDDFKGLQKKKYIRHADLPLKAKDGHLVSVEFVSSVYRVGTRNVIQCNIRENSASNQAQAAQRGDERKWMNEALRERERQMRALVSSLDDIIIEMDEQGTYLNLWSGDESNLVKPKADMLGRSVLEILGAELGARILDKCRQALTSGRSEEVEYPLEVMGGARWFQARLNPIPAAAGAAKTVSMLVRDITERKRVEEALRASEDNYRNLFNNAEIGMFRTRLDGSEILEFNKKYLEILGYTLDEVKGKPSVEIWADKRERDRMFQLLKAEGHVTDFECVLLTKQGEARTCITSFRLYRDLGILEGSIQDITERKRAEEALDWEQYLLRTLLDNLPDRIYFKDRSGRFTRISRSQAEMFGLSNSASALGKTDFDFFTEMHARPALEAEQSIMTTGQPLVGLEEKETWPDGRLTWVYTTKMPLYDKAGIIIGTFGISTDITERKGAEEALLKSEAFLREQSVRDHLTGLFNRRYMEETLERELRRAIRRHLSVGIIMLDVDGFKGFNDTRGHAAGDAVLRELGSLFLTHVRGEDIPCRYGGDEFIIVLPDASGEATQQRAVFLCEQARQLDIKFEGVPLEAITLSAGIAAFPENGLTSAEVLKAADLSLYRAKDQGQGRVVVAE